MLRPARRIVLAALAAAFFLTGCAATDVETTGAPLREPLCRPGAPPLPTLLYWSTQWRPDQKEPPLREAAAVRGIEDFLRHTDCIAAEGVQRLPPEAALPSNLQLLQSAAAESPAARRVVLIVVRELGPRLLLGLPFIVEGGTEVLIDVRVLDTRTSESMAEVSTRWRNGGLFVIKGTKTLDHDMSAALRAALLTDPPAR
jgi:hypothetical protein